jgi:hypothetical protein
MQRFAVSKMSISDEALFEQSIVKDIDDAFAEFTQDLDEFIAGRLPNRYVYGGDVISLYTRKGKHMIQGVLFQCLDVGTIVIADPYQYRGLGMRVINHMHSINPFRCTYVESILNDPLYDRLKRYGWSDAGGGPDRNVFKLTPLSKINT